MTRVGVALSGGGHRASVWAAGLLLYLADAARNGDVSSIASVSGGSITNGVVAQQMDYRQASPAEVRAGLAPLLHHIAYTGLFFWGPSTNLYVGTVLGVLGLIAGLIMAFITGIGVAAGVVLALSTAVQASACLPGAFAARRLDTAPHRFQRSAEVTEPNAIPGQMLLTDGGVYDNMADQWADGLAARVRDNAELDIMTKGLDALIVANASVGPAWTTVKASWLPIAKELSTLGRVKDVQYAVSTSTRRHDLVNDWDAAALSGHGVTGALVQIAQSPFEVPDAFAGDDRLPDRSARAREAIAWLGDSHASRAAWAAVAEQSRTLPTVLRQLEPGPTARLLWHSYVLAACNLHVLLPGFRLPPLPAEDEFRDLVGSP